MPGRRVWYLELAYGLLGEIPEMQSMASIVPRVAARVEGTDLPIVCTQLVKLLIKPTAPQSYTQLQVLCDRVRVTVLPSVMEQFEKLKNLGRGAQGTVILVRRRADNNKFCIKKIPIEDQSADDQLEVMNEIRVRSSEEVLDVSGERRIIQFEYGITNLL